jgi:carbonic anhydrase
MPDEILGRLKRFQHRYFPRFRSKYRELAEGGQQPTALFIGCSDSRIVPNMLLDSGPGEIFVVRNVGNLVPPYDASHGYHGTTAAIEFAVLKLGVRDIIVCGHSHCGAMKALYADPSDDAPHLAHWLELARGAVLPVTPSEEALRRTEQRSVVLQLERLMAYPMVAARVEKGELFLHGWLYHIEDGQVLVLDIETGEFVPLDAATAKADAEHMRGVNLLQ